jgi:hypothetical protein
LDLVYKKAGYLELTRISDSREFLVPAVVESVVAAITPKVTKLPDGNSYYEYQFTTGLDAKVTVKLSTFLPQLHAALAGASVTTPSTNVMRVHDQGVIPAASPFTYALAQAIGGTIIINDNTDSPMVSAASASASGSFSTAVSVVTFNSANAGAEFFVAYDTSMANSYHMALAAQPNTDTWTLRVLGNAVCADNEGIVKLEELRINRCKVSGSIAYPEKSNTPKGWQFDVDLVAPALGQNAIDAIWQA